MAHPTRVFIIYSKLDDKYRDELVKHLGESFDVWWDEKIAPGEDWNAAIQTKLAEAEVVLVLVSAHCLNTAYVMEEELPRAEANRIRRKQTLVPLFVGHVDVADFGVQPYEMPGARPLDLLSLQGLNRPDQPLKSLTPNQREAALADASRRLRERQRQDVATSARIIQLSCAWSGDRITVRPRFDSAARPEEVIESDRLSIRPGLRCLQILLGTEEGARGHVGHRVPKDQQRYGDHVLDQGFPVTVSTEDSEIYLLPWGDVRCNDLALRDAGWSIALQYPGRRPESVHLDRETTVACIGGDDLVPHLCDVADEFRRLVGVEPITTSEVTGVFDRRLDVLYVCGNVALEGGKVCLKIESGTVHLAELVERQCPRLLVVNLVGAEFDAVHRAIAPITAEVPMVVAVVSRTGDRIRRVGRDIVGALLSARSLESLANRVHQVHQGAIVWSRCSDWKVERCDHVAMDTALRVLLDRDDQRRAVRSAAERAFSEERPVELRVAFGNADNYVGIFGDQCRRHLDGKAFPFRLLEIRAGLDDYEHFDRLRDRALEWFDADVNDLRGRIENLVPEPLEFGQQRALLLDWRFVATDDAGLVDVVLRRWREVHEWLLDFVPPRVHVVGLLAFESSEHSLIEAKVEDIANELSFEGSIALESLKPLDRVPPYEVIRLLRELPEFPAGEEFLRIFVDKLNRRTKGRFSELVQWLEKGRSDGWHQVESEL